MHELARASERTRARVHTHTHKDFNGPQLYSAEGCKKLARDKWTSLRNNKMEELH